jgi:hypothetical protein
VRGIPLTVELTIVLTAMAVRDRIATSRIALSNATNDLGYAQGGYTGSATNASRITLASDGIFSDGASLELATMTGNVTAGFVASLTVAV